MRRNILHRSLLTGLSSSGESININNYLTIEALVDGLTASLSANYCEYCVDGDGNWKSLTAGTATEAINTGQTLSFRGNITPASGVGIGQFTVNKNFNVLGNVMSMLYGDDAVGKLNLSTFTHPFMDLFRSCSTLLSVSENFLPATTLSAQCYRAMFRGCSKLKNAPKLPATTMKSSCYYQMFYGCTVLTAAPELPATTLASQCYLYMFYGCKAFKSCPALSATTLANNCYQYMFQNCTGLTTAPELTATTLANYCYSNMFRGCSNLNYIKMLATNISASNCLSNWVNGVASTGTFVKHPNMTTLPTGANGIPSGWTVIDNT